MFIDIVIICLLFFVGIIVGLFSVITGLKLPLEEKEFFNTCDHCNDKYKWYELIPIFSFFLYKGECRYCKKDLNLWYCFLELLCGLLFAFSYMIYGISYEMLVMICLTMLSIIIFVSDFKYFVISDQPLFVSSLFILMIKFIFFGFETFLISLCSGLLIFIFMMSIRYIGNKIFKQESIGGGDIKLSVLFGFVLGIRLSIVSLVLGSFLAFPYAIYCSLSSTQKEIPFGHFLISGLYFVFIFMEPINNFLTVIF